MEAYFSIGRNNYDEINITVGDRKSGLRVVEIKTTLQEFARAITGVGYSKATFSFVPTQFTVDSILKNRETMEILVNKSSIFSKEEQSKIVEDEFLKSGLSEKGWMLFDDGTRTQQPGKKHRAILYRFVDEN